MKGARTSQSRKSGRPLSFDREAALERAMLSFWRSGYETTSIADLTASMGITAPSLYTAFGDKRRLFLEAMRRYAGDPAEMARALEAAPTARAAAHQMLMTAAVAFTGKDTPKGCLLASATASGSEASADVQSAVSEVRRGVGSLLADRIERDIASGVLPGSTRASALSDFILTVIQGMSVMARDGASRDRLLRLAEQAMFAWPDDERRPANDRHP